MLEASRRMDHPAEVGVVDTEPMPAASGSDYQYMPNIDYDMPPPSPLPDHLEELLRIINVVKSLVGTEPHGSDLRMFLFTVAVCSDRFESTLVPLPPQFRDTAGDGCEVERLRRGIEYNWPSLRVIPTMFTTNEELMNLAPDDIDAWHLLHWLLVPNPDYPQLRRLSILNLSPLCRLMGLGEPTEEPRYLIRIHYDESNPQQWRWRSQTDKTRYYAYLGLPLHKVYRFLYTGDLDVPPGETIRLYHQMEFSLQSCNGLPDQQQPEENESKPMELCWRNSLMSNTKQCALIICELPKELDESMASSPDKHFLEFVVLESASLKPRYLLMFDEQVASKMLTKWPGNTIQTSLVSSIRQRTTVRLSHMSNYISETLDGFWRLILKRNSAVRVN